MFLVISYVLLPKRLFAAQNGTPYGRACLVEEQCDKVKLIA